MNIISVSKSVIFTLLSFCVTSAQGDPLDIPNEFKSGDYIRADKMNENFEAIKSVVNSLNDSNSFDKARSQFVGFSDKKFNGAGGIFNMQRACNDFSSKSHVCSTTEVAQSTYDASVNSALTEDSKAWILIDIRSALSVPGIYRRNAPETFSCDGWKTKGAQGATLTAKGEFTVNSCNESNYVACCELKSP